MVINVSSAHLITAPEKQKTIHPLGARTARETTLIHPQFCNCEPQRVRHFVPRRVNGRRRHGLTVLGLSRCRSRHAVRISSREFGRMLKGHLQIVHRRRIAPAEPDRPGSLWSEAAILLLPVITIYSGQRGRLIDVQYKQLARLVSSSRRDRSPFLPAS